MENSAFKIVAKLQSGGDQAYFVGGYVRDMLLNYKNIDSDIDMATSALPEKVLNLFPGSKFIGESFGIVLVQEGDYKFEVATFRKDIGIFDGRRPSKVEFTTELIEDARRRDFTINAVYYDPCTEIYIDPIEGINDIEDKILRFIGDPYQRIKEDYLRLLRAVRFLAKFRLGIHEESSLAIKFLASFINDLASERVFSELNKIFTTTDVGSAVLWLDSLNLIDAIFPEVLNLIEYEQPVEYHPEGNAYTHTLKVMNYIPFNAPLYLTYAALLHDIGKAVTQGYKKGKITYYGHDLKSAEMTEVILKRLKADNNLINKTIYLVSQHMNFRNVMKMKPSKLKKLIAHPLFLDSLQLHFADCMGSSKKLDTYNFLMRKILDGDVEEARKEVKRNLITGEDLKNLGLPPGSLFKTILDDVKEKQLDGYFITGTKHEILKYICKTHVKGC